MMRCSRKVFLFATGFILLSKIASSASGFDFSVDHLGMWGQPRRMFHSEPFSLTPVGYQPIGLNLKTSDILPAFMTLHDETLASRRRIYQNRLFTLEYQRDEYVFSIGSESRSVEEQVEFIRRLLKLKKETAE